LHILHYLDSQFLTHTLYLGFNVFVLKCFWVNVRHVSISSVSIFNVRLCLRNGKDYLFGVDTSCNEALDQTICIQSSTVDYTVLYPFLIG
jgi:hypothetical protein